MKVSIFGLGYVGVVTAACFARDGINVIGVDINQNKVDLINSGRSPIIETGLKELLEEGFNHNRISATTKFEEAIAETTVSIISVGTPSRSDGALDLQYVFRVCENIGKALKIKKEEHYIIIRSTVLPGTTEKCSDILHQYVAPDQIHLAFNPEFLREGSAIKDFDEAAYTVIGSNDLLAEKMVRRLYATVDAPVISVKPEEAELIKYASNAWHATKIAFANEIGRIAKYSRVDSRKVMNVLISDKKLNISPSYLKPGFAYGGSCLPKDVRALDYFGKINNISLPLLSALSSSNSSHIEFSLNQILAKGKNKLGLLGLAFKSGTDDLRESPAVELAERLLGKGFDLKILDPAVQESKLVGSNKEFIEKKIPHLSRLMVKSAEELLQHSELLIVTHGAAEFREIMDKNDGRIQIMDLTGIFKDDISIENYEGIAW